MNHGTLQWPFNELKKKSKSWLLFILWLLEFYYDKRKLYLFYLLPRRFLWETHFGSTATRLSWKLPFCFCEPSQVFTPFRGVAFSEHFLKEQCCTFFGTWTLMGWERHQHREQRLHNSDAHFLWRLKEHFFSSYLQFANSGPQEKKTMVNLRSCCLLKIKI